MSLINKFSNSCTGLTSISLYHRTLGEKLITDPAALKAHTMGIVAFALVDLTRSLTEPWAQKLLGEKWSNRAYSICPYLLMGVISLSYRISFQANLVSFVLFNFVIPQFIEPFVYSKIEQAFLKLHNYYASAKVSPPAIENTSQEIVQPTPVIAEEKKWEDYFEQDEKSHIHLKQNTLVNEERMNWFKGAIKQALLLDVGSDKRNSSLKAVALAQAEIDIIVVVQTLKRMDERWQRSTIQGVAEKAKTLEDLNQLLTLVRSFEDPHALFESLGSIAKEMTRFSADHSMQIVREMIGFERIKLGVNEYHLLTNLAEKLTTVPDYSFEILNVIAEKASQSFFIWPGNSSLRSVLDLLEKEHATRVCDLYVKILERVNFFSYVDENGWDKPNGFTHLGRIADLDRLLKLDPKRGVELISKLKNDNAKFKIVCHTFKQLIKQSIGLNDSQQDLDSLLLSLSRLIEITFSELGVFLTADALKDFEKTLLEINPSKKVRETVQEAVKKGKSSQFWKSPIKVGLFNFLFVE